MYIQSNGIIKFNDNFNKPIKDKLKKSLGKFHTIILGSEYKHVDSFENKNDKQKTLIIGKKYRVEVTNYLKSVILDDNFNDELELNDIVNISSCDNFTIHPNYDKSLDKLGDKIDSVYVKNSHHIFPQDKELIKITDNIELDDKLLEVLSKYSNIKFTEDFDKPLNNLPVNIKNFEY